MKPVQSFPRFQKTALAAAFVALACSGCIEITMTQPGGDAKAQATRSAGRAISGEITTAKALEFLYGKVMIFKPGEDAILGENCREWAPWKPPVGQGKFKEYFEGHENYKDKTMAVCTLLGARYTQQGVQKFMLGTQAVHYESHNVFNPFTSDVPWPMIGMAVFANDGGQWKLEVEDKYVSTVSMEGPGMKLQRVGPEKYGILVSEFTHYGAGCSSTTSSLLMPYGGGIKSFALNAGLTQDELIEAECGDASVSFDTASSGEYYDVIATQMIPQGSKTVKKTRRLRFENGEYKAVKSAKKASAKKRK